MPGSASSSARCAASKISSGRARADAVAALDLVGVGDRLAREPAAGALEPASCARSQRVRCGSSVGASSISVRSAAAAAGAGRVHGRLARDPLGERRRPVVGVDELRDVAAEPEAQLEVALDDGQAGPLEQRGLALPDADAEGREPVAAAAAAQLVQERDDEARAAHPERMAERDRAAVDVHALRVEAELADHREALRRERLVQLDEVEVGDADAGPREQLAHGRHRPDAHHARIDAGDGAADEAAEGLGAERARLLLARDHERGGAVVEAARVAGGDRAALAERRLQRRELLGARVRPRVLVARDVADRDELVGEAAGLVGCRPALLRASAKASCSSRETPQRSATFSPVSPIDSSGNSASRRGLGKRQPSVVS